MNKILTERSRLSITTAEHEIEYDVKKRVCDIEIVAREFNNRLVRTPSSKVFRLLFREPPGRNCQLSHYFLFFPRNRKRTLHTQNKPKQATEQKTLAALQPKKNKHHEFTKVLYKYTTQENCVNETKGQQKIQSKTVYVKTISGITVKCSYEQTIEKTKAK